MNIHEWKSNFIPDYTRNSHLSYLLQPPVKMCHDYTCYTQRCLNAAITNASIETGNCSTTTQESCVLVANSHLSYLLQPPVKMCHDYTCYTQGCLNAAITNTSIETGNCSTTTQESCVLVANSHLSYLLQPPVKMCHDYTCYTQGCLNAAITNTSIETGNCSTTAQESCVVSFTYILRLRTTKSQTSLRIRTVWSAPLLLAVWKV